MKHTNFSLILALLFIHLSTNAQTKGAFEKKVFTHRGDSLLYQILYPPDYNPNSKYPLVLFLHGAGERGQDNERQMSLGSDLFLQDEIQKKYPAIVVFPQCPDDIMWTNRTKHLDENGKWVFNFPVKPTPPLPAELTNLLIDELLQTTAVDPERTYLMGISMGGIATLEFLYRWPDKYAAAVAICGGHDSHLAEKYKHIPIWFFHGDADDVVPAEYSGTVFNAVKDGNKKTKYTNYPNINHNSWDKALAEPKLLKWLFKTNKQ